MDNYMVLLIILFCAIINIEAQCPSGTVQIGSPGADISGCGLQSCPARSYSSTIEQCVASCVANSQCIAITWADYGGDANFPSDRVCTLYDSDVPTHTWGSTQLFCALSATTTSTTTDEPTNAPTLAPSLAPTQVPTDLPTEPPTCPDYSGNANPCNFYSEECCPTENGICQYRTTDSLCLGEGDPSCCYVATTTTTTTTEAPSDPVCIDALTLGRNGNYYNGDFVDVGETEFNRLFREDSSQKIIKRECSGCRASHQEIYYKRLTNTNTYNVYGLMKSTWVSTNNVLNTDFELYSTLSDALAGTNRWTYCNYDDPGVGPFRDCGPTGKIDCEWTADVNYPGKNWYSIAPSCANDAKFLICVDEEPTTTTTPPATTNKGTTTSTTVNGCPTDGFIYVEQPLSYEEARKYCRDRYGSTLATISDAQEISDAVDLIGDETVWFGLYSRGTRGQWKFLNGDECTADSMFKCIDFWRYRLNRNANYRPRCIGTSEGGYQCANFDGDEEMADNDIDCEDELPFLCDSCVTTPGTTKPGTTSFTGPPPDDI